MVKNPTRHKGIIVSSDGFTLWTCPHLHAAIDGAKRCASRQRDRMYKVASKNVLAHDRQKTKA